MYEDATTKVRLNGRKSTVLELSNFRWGGGRVFKSSDQLAAERNLPIIIHGRNHASRVVGVWIGHSQKRGREAPEIWRRSPNRGRSPRKSGGRGLGRGLGEPLPPQKIFGISNSKSFNLVYSWKGNPEIIDFSQKSKKKQFYLQCNQVKPTPC